jgi:hypothetical protein
MQVDSRLQNPGYLWRAGTFGTCNNSCGTGIQTREVFCVSASGPLSGENLCPTTKPQAQQTCADYSGCSYTWSMGSYGACSITCGTGVRQRSVLCLRVDPAKNASSSLVNSSFCMLGSIPPASSETCSDVSQCTFTWQVGSWGACSSSCGTGWRSRAVDCVRSDKALANTSFCALQSKPAMTEGCSEASGCTYQYVDECATGTHTCSSFASCTDSLGSFQCLCNVGYTGSGTACTDVDECTSRTPGLQSTCTHVNTVCRNTPGSFVCQCVIGTYAVSNGSCIQCPRGTTTTASGATSPSSCSLCAEGYYGTVATGCVACPQNSSSSAGTTQRSGCKCILGFEGNFSSSGGSCVLVNSDPASLLFAGEPGRSCNQFCGSIGRTCQQGLVQAGYKVQEIMDAINRSTAIARDTTFFTVGAFAPDNWWNSRQKCLDLGADAATIHNAAENAIARQLCETDLCTLGLMWGEWYGDGPYWIDGSGYNGWYPTRGRAMWNGHNYATMYQDVWMFLQNPGGVRMQALCKRLSPISSWPKNCSGGLRSSDLPYAPYISDSNTCYTAEKLQDSTCEAVPNRAHSRLCACSAPCKEDYYGSDGACKKCPPNSRSLSGSTSFQDCICPEGYFMLTGQNNTACVSCPAASTSTPGSTSLADCVCVSGYYLDDSLRCTQCPAGSLSPSGSIGNQSCACPAGTYGTPGTTPGCRPCPHMSTSPLGSVDISQCVCPKGFGVARLGYSRYISSADDVCDAEAGRWILGQTGQSCTDACASRGRACQQIDSAAFTTPVIQLLSQPVNFDLTCTQIIQEGSDTGRPYPSIEVASSNCFYLALSGGNPATCARSSAGSRCLLFCMYVCGVCLYYV